MNCTVIVLPQCPLLHCTWTDGSQLSSSVAIHNVAFPNTKESPSPLLEFLTIKHSVLFFKSKFIIRHIFTGHLEHFSILKYNLYSKETEGQGMLPFGN